MNRYRIKRASHSKPLLSTGVNLGLPALVQTVITKSMDRGCAKGMALLTRSAGIGFAGASCVFPSFGRTELGKFAGRQANADSQQIKTQHCRGNQRRIQDRVR